MVNLSSEFVGFNNTCNHVARGDAVMRLLATGLETLQTAICELYRLRTPEEFRGAVSAIMLRAIPADSFAWQTCALAPQPKMMDYLESDNRSTPELRALWTETMHLHPFAQYYTRTGDLSALILSDFLSQVELNRTPHMRDSLRPLGCKYLMSVATMTNQGMIGGLNFLREKKDFTESDRTMLNLLRPHAMLARQNAETLAALLVSGRVASPADRGARIGELTKREIEIGQWIALGKTNHEISIILSLSQRTVEKHVEKILVKLGVENRTSAALLLKEPPPHP